MMSRWALNKKKLQGNIEVELTIRSRTSMYV